MVLRAPEQQLDERTAAGPWGALSSRQDLLSVESLRVAFPAKGGQEIAVVEGLSYGIAQGETLGIVGESGCGKTMTSLSLTGLLPGRGRATGTVRFARGSILEQSDRDWRQMRGRDVAMIFQEPMSAMNPVMSVGAQIGKFSRSTKA